MTLKQQYIDYCNQNNKDIPLFMQPWYLDIVCNENWDVTAKSDNGEFTAWLPYYIYKQRFFTSLRPAAFMPYQGFVLNKLYSEKHRGIHTNNHSLYHFENSISEYFATKIDQMNLSACFLRISPEFFCATPFIQHGFSANVRYTYRLNLTDSEIFDSFSPVMRKKLRKAEKELQINWEYTDLKEIYRILSTTFTRQKKIIPYSYELFSHFVTTITQKNQGKMLVCQDANGNICSALFIAWDNTSAYSLIGGNNYDNIHRDAGAFTQYESIKYARSMGLTVYDFEGSMLKGVEEFFQHFGAIRTPYLSLEKYYSKIYRHLRAIKGK